MSKFFKIAVLSALSSGVMVSCSSDAPFEDQGGTVTEDQTLYVKVAVHGDNDNGSKAAGDDGAPGAGDFDENPAADESTLKNLYFVFYDKDGNMVGDLVSVSVSDGLKESSDPSVHKIYESTVAVTLLKGEGDPASVMCYANPLSLNDVQQPLSVLQTITRDLVMDDTDGSGTSEFPMSNSVYYPTDGGQPQVAVPVKDGQLFDSQAEAEKATAGQTLDIYIERRASRLNFSLNEDIYNSTEDNVTVNQTYTSAEGDVNTPKYELTFHIEGWDVNAQTRNTYLVKSFRKEGNGGVILTDNYTYDELNSVINENGGAWAWNSQTYHRSYWAISPAYFVSSYPEVASDVNNVDNTNLLYIVPENYDWKTTLDGTTNEYYREATVGSIALKSKNPAAAVASVVLKGYYTIKDTPIDFYSYQSKGNGEYYIFPKEAVAGTNGMTMMQRFLQLQGVLYKKKTDSQYEKITESDLVTYPNIKVMHPADLTLAKDPSVTGSEDMKVASNKQTLQVETAPGATATALYYASGNGYEQVTADNLRAVNRALIQQLNFASFYNKGQAYFNIPIKHLGWYRSGNTQKPAEKIDWSLVRVGDFGMVRNHRYTIEVESIKGLGTGIGTPTDPIIPPSETKDYYVKYKVNCLRWAIVPKQSVNL